MGGLVLFGGTTVGGATLNDTWEFRAGAWTDLTKVLSNHPPAYVGAVMAFDPLEKGLLLFGGTYVSGSTVRTSSATWLFANGTWTNLTPGLSSSPPALSRMGLSYDAADGYTLLFGGLGAKGTLTNQTWKFAGGQWKNLTSSTGKAPPPSCCFGSDYDPALKAVLVTLAPHGVTAGHGTVTWSFSGGAWTNRTGPLGPTARMNASATFDPYLNGSILFGGTTTPTTLPRDVWGYVGGGWVNITPSSVAPYPAARGDAALAYDPGEHGVVLFGGYEFNQSNELGDTWVFGALPTPTVSGAPDRTLTDVRVLVTYNATPGGNGTLPYSYLWNFGDGFNGTQANLTHAYVLAANYTVWVTVTDAAGHSSQSAYTTIVVRPGPSRVFAYTSRFTTEVGVPDFFNASGNGGTSPWTYLWDFGDGSRSAGQYVNHTFLVNQNFTVKVTFADSLGGSVYTTLIITVRAHVNVTFTTSLPVGEVGVSITFSSRVIHGLGPYSYLWEFGDGGSSVLSNPAHAYAAGGNYTVLVTVTDGFGVSDSANEVVTVGRALVVSAVANRTGTDMQTPVQFSAVLQYGVGPFQYLWTFADGTSSSSPNPVHAFVRPGSYPVSVAVSDSVGAVVNGSVLVVAHSLPFVQPSASTELTTTGQTVQFSVASSGGTSPFVFSWDFGDGTAATGAAVSHGYSAAGTFQVRVTLIDAAGQRATSTLSMTVESGSTGGSTNGGSSSSNVPALLVIAAGVAVAVGIAMTGYLVSGRRPSEWEASSAPSERSAPPPSPERPDGDQTDADP